MSALYLKINPDVECQNLAQLFLSEQMNRQTDGHTAIRSLVHSYIYYISTLRWKKETV